MPEQASTGKKLRASSRIAAGALGVLSVLGLPVAALVLQGWDRLSAATSAAVSAALFLYAAWSGASPAFFEHPEIMWSEIAGLWHHPFGRAGSVSSPGQRFRGQASAAVGTLAEIDAGELAKEVAPVGRWSRR
jgi:hypothetical protein